MAEFQRRPSHQDTSPSASSGGQTKSRGRGGPRDRRRPERRQGLTPSARLEAPALAVRPSSGNNAGWPSFNGVRPTRTRLPQPVLVVRPSSHGPCHGPLRGESAAGAELGCGEVDVVAGERAARRRWRARRRRRSRASAGRACSGGAPDWRATCGSRWAPSGRRRSRGGSPRSSTTYGHRAGSSEGSTSRTGGRRPLVLEVAGERQGAACATAARERSGERRSRRRPRAARTL